MIFSNIVEQIQNLSSEEKEDLVVLLEKYIIEDRRKRIYKNYKKAVKEQNAGTLNFLKDVGAMKKSLSE